MNADQTMHADSTQSSLPPARMIAFGSAVLTEGFALIGFETFPDPAPETIEEVLRELLRNQQTALVVIEQSLARNAGHHLTRAQREGGRIVITEIPEITQSGNYHSRVENLMQSILGPASHEVQV